MKQRFVLGLTGLHLATAATLALLTFVPLALLSVAHAEARLDLGAGVSYINQQNLQSNQVSGASDATDSRAGTVLTLDGRWNRFTPEGGLSAGASTRLDRGTGDAGTITAHELDGAWMGALGQRWLVRLGGRLGRYRDDDQRAYDNDYRGVEAALGWFGDRHAGLDLTLSRHWLDYDDDPQGAYDATRTLLGATWHLPRENEAGGWSATLGSGRFDAPDMPGYSYDSTSFAIHYATRGSGRLDGGASLSWRENLYDPVTLTTTTTTSPFGGMGGMGTTTTSTTRLQQRDTYLTASLQVGYALSAGSRLHASLSAGRYRSSLTDDRPLVSAFVGIRHQLH